MKSQTRKKKAGLPPFQSGQIWQLADSRVEIGLVGNRLVHYRHFKPSTKRPAVQLSGKGVLEKFLQDHDASLVETVPAP